MTVTLYKTEKDASLKYFSFHDRQGHLFSQFTLTTVWGNSLFSGKEKLFTFTTRKEMDAKVREIFRSKIKQGYKILYSFSRESRYRKMFRDASGIKSRGGNTLINFS